MTNLNSIPSSDLPGLAGSHGDSLAGFKLSEISYSKEKLTDFLAKMILLRRYEEKCAQEYSAGKIRGFLHLYIGEEASATGVCSALLDSDAVFATYREHAHALLRGVPPEAVMAEMFGKVEGVCHGRGGSMHIFDRSKNFFGGNAIVAGGIPLAVGFGLGLKMQGSKAISVCFFGEGAIAEGEFHESMNLAELWQVPVLFVCENNFYAMGTALDRSEAQTDLLLKARSYGVRSLRCDGMNVQAVHRAAAAAVEFVRSESQPVFLECQTYRFRAHSMFDPELYRSSAEVAEWKKKDPIQLLQSEMLALGQISRAEIDALQDAADEVVRRAVEFAEKGHLEPLADLGRFVISDAEGAGLCLN